MKKIKKTQKWSKKNTNPNKPKPKAKTNTKNLKKKNHPNQLQKHLQNSKTSSNSSIASQVTWIVNQNKIPIT